MKVIIAGSRQIDDYDYVLDAVLSSPFAANITCVISGTAQGVDRLGEAWAKENELDVERYPAKWKTHGKAAGPIRNREMAAIADAAIVVWDGVSTGSKNMIDTMQKLGKPVYIYIVEKE